LATTSAANDPVAPHFGEPASSVYNVIDCAASVFAKGGGRRTAGRGTCEGGGAFKFTCRNEIVALTPRWRSGNGFELTAEEAKKPYVEVSGAKASG